MIELALTIFVLGWCSYRITRFFVEDSLLGMGSEQTLQNGKIVFIPNSPMGARVARFAYDKNGQDRNWLRGKIGDLLSCTFCFGAWVSFSAWALWTWSLPWQPAVEFQKWWICAFAVAGVQSYISSRADA